MIILNRRFTTPLPEFYKLTVVNQSMVEHSAVNRKQAGLDVLCIGETMSERMATVDTEMNTISGEIANNF